MIASLPSDLLLCYGEDDTIAMIGVIMNATSHINLSIGIGFLRAAEHQGGLTDLTQHAATASTYSTIVSLELGHLAIRIIDLNS